MAELKGRLYDAVHKKYVSNHDVEKLCHSILNFDRRDIYANFYLATCKDDESLGILLSEIDLAEYEEDIPDFLEYLITALKPRWILPVSALMDRYYTGTRIADYDKQRDRLEQKIKKLDDGCFDPMIPRDVFVAYSSADMPMVTKLISVLEDSGYTCFCAARNLQHGSGAVENYNDLIHTAMKNCRAVVFVSSSHSRSHSCDAEAELAYIKEHCPDMLRIEYLIETYQGKAIEKFFEEFFSEKAYCKSPSAVVMRLTELFNQKKTMVFAPVISSDVPKVQAEKKTKNPMLILLPLAVVALAVVIIFQQVNFGNMSDSSEQTTTSSALPNQTSESTSDTSQTTVQTDSSQTTTSTTTTNTTANTAGTTTTTQKTEIPILVGSEGLEFVSNGDGTCYVSGIGTCQDTEIQIPSISPAGDRVIGIGKGSFSWRSIQSVIIPEGVVYIEQDAFYYCSSLKTIIFPSTLREIRGTNVFAFCKVTEVHISNLEAWCQISFAHNASNPLSGGKAYLYISGEQVTELNIPHGVTQIRDYAFVNCQGIQKIVLPDTVTEIGRSICSSAESLVMPKSVMKINTYAFSGSNLKDIYYQGTEEEWNAKKFSFFYGGNVHFEG